MNIKPSKIFEVYENVEKGKKQLYTLNLIPGRKVYGEKLFMKGNQEFREWNPFKSKLASTILKGGQNIHLRKGNIILYLGSSTGTTVSHVSDIIGEKGMVFGVDNAPTVMREFMKLVTDRENITPIMESAAQTEKLRERLPKEVDILYQDVAQNNQVQIFLNNLVFVKKGGYGLLAVKARSIDVTKNPKTIFKDVRKQLEKETTIIDYRELHPYQKDHCMFMVKK